MPRALFHAGLIAFVLTFAHALPAFATNRVDIELDDEERSLLEQINQYRSTLGLVPLTPVPRLNSVAFAHSRDMATRGYFGHVDPEGRTPFDRMARVGYDVDNEGENLAAGRPNGAGAFAQWRRSPSHDAAMRDPAYRAIGIGRVIARGSRYESYWTAVFGDEVRAVDFDASAIAPATFEATEAPHAARVQRVRRVTRTRRALRFAPRRGITATRH